MRLKIRLLSPGLILISGLLVNNLAFPATTYANGKKVGIWYSPMYSKEGTYDWADNYAVGATGKYLADVNHDGKSDALAYWDTNSVGFRGLLMVALSNGSSFGTPQAWIPDDSHRGASKVFFSDVNGDNNADIVQYFAGSCTWVVALSNGTNGFGSFQIWRGQPYGYGCGSQDQFVADVTGDGKADAVVFFDTGTSGNWYVAGSVGTSFWGTDAYTPWITSFGHGSGKRFMADVTGDGKADAITYTDNTITPGNWWAAASNGTNLFTNPQNWGTWHGYQSNSQLLGDVDADGKADALVYYGNFDGESRWYKASSTGSNFQVPNNDSIWKLAHGNWSKSYLNAAVWVGLGNVDGDVNGSGYGTADPVVFQDYYKSSSPYGGRAIGKWRAMIGGNTYNEPNQINTWQAYEIQYRPLIGGVPSTYDVKTDISAVNADLQRIDEAGIDYLLLDLTNGIYDLANNAGSYKWITERAKTVCQQIAAYNSSGGGHSLKYAIATGRSQWHAYNDVGVIETEADYVKRNFVNDSTCGPHYFQWQSKPLLANYFKDTAQKNYWQNQYPNKTATPNFTTRFVFGSLPHLPDSGLSSSYPSSTGSGCGNFPSGANIYPKSGEYGNYLGWGMPYGSAAPGTAKTMIVQPGWNNRSGQIIARTQNSVEAKFYSACSWNRVQSNKSRTDMVVINSYNEYAEETAVAPTNTRNVPKSQPGANWSSENLYWTATVSQVSQFKN